MTDHIKIIRDYEYGLPIRNTVLEHGIDEHGATVHGFDGKEYTGVLKMREFNLGRLAALLATGTDRDMTSDQKHYNGLFQNELEAVRRDGRPVDHYTYANSLYSHEDFAKQALYTMAHGVAIYRPEALAVVGHDSWNGLHKFTDIPSNKALVAVIMGSQDSRVHTEQLVANHPGIDRPDHAFVSSLKGAIRRE